jgi:hypothetical protein
MREMAGAYRRLSSMGEDGPGEGLADAVVIPWLELIDP